MGHGGLRRSPASHWHSSTLFRRFLLSPTLTCWPGPRQAEPSRLLWADQSERKSAHGHLRPQVLNILESFLQSQGSIFRVPVCLCFWLVFYCSSPSLVALEVDSEEDSTEPKSPLSPLSSDVEKSEEKRETFPPSPDLTCTRSQSASSACEPTTKVKHHLSLSHTFIKYFHLYHEK